MVLEEIRIFQVGRADSRLRPAARFATKFNECPKFLGTFWWFCTTARDTPEFSLCISDSLARLIVYIFCSLRGLLVCKGKPKMKDPKKVYVKPNRLSAGTNDFALPTALLLRMQFRPLRVEQLAVNSMIRCHAPLVII